MMRIAGAFSCGSYQFSGGTNGNFSFRATPRTRWFDRTPRRLDGIETCCGLSWRPRLSSVRYRMPIDLLPTSSTGQSMEGKPEGDPAASAPSEGKMQVRRNVGGPDKSILRSLARTMQHDFLSAFAETTYENRCRQKIVQAGYLTDRKKEVLFGGPKSRGEPAGKTRPPPRCRRANRAASSSIPAR